MRVANWSLGPVGDVAGNGIRGGRAAREHPRSEKRGHETEEAGAEYQAMHGGWCPLNEKPDRPDRMIRADESYRKAAQAIT